VGKEDFPLLCRIEATSQSVLTVLLEVKKDGFVKSPSVLLGAGLRFNFVVAAHL
jgi:hypothetical protein